MKYYCNRRTPKTTAVNNVNNTPVPQQISEPQPDTPVYPDINDDIVLPPSEDYNSDEDYEINPEGQGGAFSQSGGYKKQNQNFNNSEVIPAPIYYDNMSGKFDLISIPHEHTGVSVKSMTNFLDRYTGKYICLDLWTNECHHEEVCGTLVETGNNFLVINCYDTDKLTLIDLKAIRYINVYCR